MWWWNSFHYQEATLGFTLQIQESLKLTWGVNLAATNPYSRASSSSPSGILPSNCQDKLVRLSSTAPSALNWKGNHNILANCSSKLISFVLTLLIMYHLFQNWKMNMFYKIWGQLISGYWLSCSVNWVVGKISNVKYHWLYFYLNFLVIFYCISEQRTNAAHLLTSKKENLFERCYSNMSTVQQEGSLNHWWGRWIDCRLSMKHCYWGEFQILFTISERVFSCAYWAKIIFYEQYNYNVKCMVSFMVYYKLHQP